MAKTCADGDPIWIEIPATGDSEELKSFYQGIFPKWKFHASQPDAHVSGYEVAKGLTGGIVKMPQGCKPGDQPMGRGLTVYYSVSSLDKTEKKVHELGGKTCLEKTKQGDEGYFMNFLDPQGNRFGCHESVQ